MTAGAFSAVRKMVLIK